jgi:hypothetical protein
MSTTESKSRKKATKKKSPKGRERIAAAMKARYDTVRDAREARVAPHRELIRTILFEAFDNGHNYHAAIDILLTMRRATNGSKNGDDFAEALFDINWALDDVLFGGDLAEMAGLSHD